MKPKYIIWRFEVFPWVWKRKKERIVLNVKEYATTANGDIMLFDSMQDAVNLLNTTAKENKTAEQWEKENGIHICLFVK